MPPFFPGGVVTNCETCEIIEEPPFNGGTYNAAIEDAMLKMTRVDSAYGNDIQAINDFYGILTYPLANPDTNEQVLIDLAYESMLMAHADAYEQGTLEELKTGGALTVPEATLQVLTVIDSLKARADSAKVELSYLFDKVNIYRTAEDFPQALMVFDIIDTYGKDSIESVYAEQLKCLTRAERDIWYSGVNPLRFDE